MYFFYMVMIDPSSQTPALKTSFWKNFKKAFTLTFYTNFLSLLFPSLAFTRRRLFYKHLTLVLLLLVSFTLFWLVFTDDYPRVTTTAIDDGKTENRTSYYVMVRSMEKMFKWLFTRTHSSGLRSTF